LGKEIKQELGKDLITRLAHRAQEVRNTQLQCEKLCARFRSGNFSPKDAATGTKDTEDPAIAAKPEVYNYTKKIKNVFYEKPVNQECLLSAEKWQKLIDKDILESMSIATKELADLYERLLITQTIYLYQRGDILTLVSCHGLQSTPELIEALSIKTKFPPYKIVYLMS